MTGHWPSSSFSFYSFWCWKQLRNLSLFLHILRGGRGVGLMAPFIAFVTSFIVFATSRTVFIEGYLFLVRKSNRKNKHTTVMTVSYNLYTDIQYRSSHKVLPCGSSSGCVSLGPRITREKGSNPPWHVLICSAFIFSHIWSQPPAVVSYLRGLHSPEISYRKLDDTSRFRQQIFVEVVKKANLNSSTVLCHVH